MEILNREAISIFAKTHSPSRKPLSRWLDIAGSASWNNILDVQRNFNSAEDVKGYVVFNIHGNDYRLITAIRYLKKQIFVHEIFTHAGYDRWKP